MIEGNVDEMQVKKGLAMKCMYILQFLWGYISRLTSRESVIYFTAMR